MGSDVSTPLVSPSQRRERRSTFSEISESIFEKSNVRRARTSTFSGFTDITESRKATKDSLAVPAIREDPSSKRSSNQSSSDFGVRCSDPPSPSVSWGPYLRNYD